MKHKAFDLSQISFLLADSCNHPLSSQVNMSHDAFATQSQHCTDLVLHNVHL